jgi:CheY-like chemotaxis protein
MAKYKILMVDDMASVRKFTRFGLEKNHPNLEIQEASNGKEAQAMLEQEKYDLVLCDWEMPVMSGSELLTWIRKHSAAKETPFIMVTARNDKESVINALQAGVSGYVVKPFTIEGLIQKMTEVNRKFDRRQYERYDISGDANLQFNDRIARGVLLDLSMGGLLCNVPRDNPIPNILEKVLSDIKLNNSAKMTGIEGFVIRVQAAEAFLNSEYIKIAVKFMDMADKKSKELKDLLGSVSQQ